MTVRINSTGNDIIRVLNETDDFSPNEQVSESENEDLWKLIVWIVISTMSLQISKKNKQDNRQKLFHQKNLQQLPVPFMQKHFWSSNFIWFLHDWQNFSRLLFEKMWTNAEIIKKKQNYEL